MKRPPAFFEAVREKAANIWNQLEQAPRLAGPWHQMFEQVKNPRHVLSELLQNADDAGATEITVRLEDQVFIFEHNGEDFSEENFESLCNFCFSNKKTLHTIGFRGMGFKSTFSLGDRVKLFTPTLSVCFRADRFIEPIWLPEKENLDTNGKTHVRVEISDKHRKEEVNKSLKEWLKDPIPLLFFRNIRRMRVDDQEMNWRKSDLGPTDKSEWMILCGKEDECYLLIRSDSEKFPEDALDEIKKERKLDDSTETNTPPCTIQIVLTANAKTNGRLYVALPTDINTELPFACNAPFIQDPGRSVIKNLGISPTNRWLLDKVGELAASTMLLWLDRNDLSSAERARAYNLFPKVDEDDYSTVVQKAFKKEIEGRPLLLTEDGNLTPIKQSIALPKTLLEVWPSNKAASIFDKERRPALCQYINDADRNKLVKQGFVDEIGQAGILETLRESSPIPKPEEWPRLLKLWAYVAPKILGYRPGVNAKDVHIVPVRNEASLCALGKTVRLDGNIPQAESNWAFLYERLKIIDQGWLCFLAKHQSTKKTEAANGILEEMGLNGSSNWDEIIGKAASEIFSDRGKINLQEGIKFAQFTAKWNAKVDDRFKYATRDGIFRSSTEKILFDENGELEKLLPQNQREKRLLHQDYTESFALCSKADWQKWVESKRANLWMFVPLEKKNIRITEREKIKREAKRRDFDGDLFFRYKTSEFVVEDWDFCEDYWEHWKVLAEDDKELWASIVCHMLKRKVVDGTNDSASLFHISRQYHKKRMTDQSVLPSWVLNFRNRPCLRDTKGLCRKPSALLRRTKETELLMGKDRVSFVESDLDKENLVPLLDLIGVRSTVLESDSAPELLEDLSIENLMQKPPSKVKSLLREQPRQIWEKGHWINLSGELVAVKTFSYSLTKRHLVPCEHLHASVKEKTADLRFLPTEIASEPPFSQLSALMNNIEERLHSDSRPVGRSMKKEWLEALGDGLRKKDFGDNPQRIHDLTNRLIRTEWQITSDLKAIPCINGECAGESREVDVLWLGKILHVSDRLPRGKQARCISDEIGKIFDDKEIKDALLYSFGRPPQDVVEYLNENFKLHTVDFVSQEVVGQTSIANKDECKNPRSLVRENQKSSKLEEFETQDVNRRKINPQASRAAGIVSEEDEKTKHPSLTDEKSIRKRALEYSRHRVGSANSIEEEDSMSTTYTEVRVRPNQKEFRDTLMRAYEKRCAVSGCKVDAVLRAAHICPVSEGGKDTPSNGLLLRADLHALFDAHLISIDTANMKVLVAQELEKSDYKSFSGCCLHTPDNPEQQPNKEDLDKHKQKFDRKNL